MRDHDLDIDPPSTDLLAGEYVLGVLDAAQYREARLRAAREPAFARLVDDWSTRLDPLHDELEPSDVPAHLWPRIRSRLGWSPVTADPGAGESRLRFWRATTAAGFAAAAALAVVTVMRPAPVVEAPAPVVSTDPAPAVPMQPLPVTRLEQTDGTLAFLATIDLRTGGMWLVPVPGTTAPDGRVPVLWIIPEGGAPRALGYVGSRHSHWVDVPKPLHDALEAGSMLAVTLEPAAEQPPQAPSSAPVAAGGISL